MQAIFRKSYLVGMILLQGFLAGCRSEDFGSLEPDEVEVFGPAWNQGIEKLVIQKCANCHVSKRGKFVPSNTPTTIDSIGSRDFWLTARNLSRLLQIRKRFSETPDIPMPPRYATPFSDNERLQFVAFVNERIESLTNGTSTTSTTSTEACTETSDWSDAIAGALAANCASAACHATSSVGVPALTTQAEWLANRDTARALIRSGSMPKGDASFASTDSGKLLLGTLGCP